MGTTTSTPSHSPHRSLNCRCPTVVEWVNTTAYSVTTTWLNYDGRLTPYPVVAPGQRYRQPTFTAHPWIFVTNDPEGRPCVVDDMPVFYAPLAAGSVPVQAVIRPASSLQWSQADHLCFPAPFLAQTAALLCCHHRLSAPLTHTSHKAAKQQPVWQQPWRQQLAWLRRFRPGRPVNHVQLDASPDAHGLAPQDAAAAAMQPRESNLGDLPKVTFTLGGLRVHISGATVGAPDEC
jgi:hypothetical protein